MLKKFSSKFMIFGAFVAVALLAMSLPLQLAAQDRDDDDPPGRAARLGYMEGSVSFQPAGENEWVEAAPNRPMTTGDKLWADRDSRAEVQLGSASIRLGSNTGFSFINLDDRTAQIQLSSGTIDVRVRRLDRDDVLEVDTPNQAFSIFQPGRYRVEASEDGTYTVVTVRDGEGESTGNGQTYTVHQGQRATFSGTDRLNADVEQVGDPDDFDRWASDRDRRFENSRTARYVSPDVVGASDLDEYGDWQGNPEYGNVWYPRVAVGWAPYHTGHWAWIDPWGWTWVDDAPWGYAPFHYGRWAFVGSRWGWIPGPMTVRPVYAPALVVFVGGAGPGFGGNVAWFALGPREVYVPSYRVSPAYVNRVNISNTTVNQTTVTNVYNTTIVNKTTVINNVTYVNRGVNGAVTAVPQGAFAGGQSVSRVAVPVNQRQLASAQITSGAQVAPARTAVLGVHANTANRVAAPPQSVQARPVVAKAPPPPPPVPFAAKQQELAAHPGRPVARQEMQRLRPASAPAAQPLVRQAPPGRPAQPTVGKPDTQPAASRPGNRPGQPPANPPAANQPAANRPANRPAPPPTTNERPGANPPPNRAEPNQPANRPAEPPARNDRPSSAQPPANRPGANPPANQPANRPFEPPTRNDRPPAAQPNNRPEAPPPSRPETNRPEPNPPANRPAEPPSRNDRPPSAQPNNRPEAPPPSRPDTNRPEPNRAQPNRSPEPAPRNERPPAAQPPENRPAPPPQNTRPSEPPQRQEQPQSRPQNPPPAERPAQRTPPPEARPQPQPQPQHQEQQKKQQTAEEKKRQEQPKKPQ